MIQLPQHLVEQYREYSSRRGGHAPDFAEYLKWLRFLRKAQQFSR